MRREVHLDDAGVRHVRQVRAKVFDVEEISDSIPSRPWPMAHSLHMKENTKKDALTKNTKQQSKLVKKKVKLTSKAKPKQKI